MPQSQPQPPVTRQTTVLAIANNKGGVGKTTTALSLIAQACLAGNDGLLVGNDHSNPGVRQLAYTGAEQQTLDLNLTTRRLYQDPLQGYTSIRAADKLRVDLDWHRREADGSYRYDVALLDSLYASRGWQPPAQGGRLDLIADCFELASVFKALRPELRPVLPAGIARPELVLRTALAPARGHYDWIFIDTAPATPDYDIGVANAFWAADFVLVPLAFNQLSAAAALNTLQQVKQVSAQRINEGLPALKTLGVLLHSHRGNVVHRATEQRYRDSVEFGPLLFQTVLPFDPSLDIAEQTHSPYPFVCTGPSGICPLLPALAREVQNRVGHYTHTTAVA